MKKSAIALIVFFIMAMNTTVLFAETNEVIEPGKILIVEEVVSPNETGYWCDRRRSSIKKYAIYKQFQHSKNVILWRQTMGISVWN